jgi:hypothetical protein
VQKGCWYLVTCEGCNITSGITALITNSMVPDILLKVGSSSTCQRTDCFLYGTWRFVTVFTKTRHWTLSWASRIQFATSIPVSYLNVILEPEPWSFQWSPSFGRPNQNPVDTSALPHACYVSRPSSSVI